MQKLYQEISQLFEAWKNCIESNNTEWEQNHKRKIEYLCENMLPSGSGIDSGIQFDFENSKMDRLVLNSSYHSMDENGYYDGWIDFKIIIKPSLSFNFTLDIIGKFGKKQDIKDYLNDTIHYHLHQFVDNVKILESMK